MFMFLYVGTFRMVVFMSIDTVTFLSRPSHFERLPPDPPTGSLLGSKSLLQKSVLHYFPSLCFAMFSGATVPVSLVFADLFNVG